VYAVVLVGSVLVRWPLVGFMIGSVTGEPTQWHNDRKLVSLCSRLTLLLAAPCVLRVLVQYPLWATSQAGWLGVAKLAMGWPLQIAALASMAGCSVETTHRSRWHHEQTPPAAAECSS
jgi:hypothetical protein